MSTNRITSNKRDREKAKEEKRKEKQLRKEQRQSAGTSSFDDMIAYQDEFGQFHDTPPEKPKEEIDVNDIEISIPKQSEMADDDLPLSGCVDYFNSSKGFGFIKADDSQEKFFFHISMAPDNIAEGDKVTFETERGPRGMNAVNIIIIK
jgi:cold shock CspA family protein